MKSILKTLKDKWRQIALGVAVLASVLALIIIWLCSALPVWHRLRATGYIITITIASIGVYVANRRAKAMEDTARAGQETARAGHDANEQKAYNEAVTNLGNKDSTSVRLGGIYGLFDLAQSKPSRRRNITEILCAHLRETTQGKAYQKNNGQQPSNEIQSLLNVLCELNEGNLANEKTRDIKLNLEQSYLRGANLGDKNLCRAQLHGAKLQGARLTRAQLQGVLLSGAAQLQGAYLSGAQLQGSSLWCAQLQGAFLSGAQLQGANLGIAGLQGAFLGEAGLQGANLFRAQLQGAHLPKAELYGATGALGAHLDHPFEECIKSRIDKGAELEGVAFSGGLTDEKITTIQNVLFQLAQYGLYDKDEAEKLCAELREHHLGKPSHKPPPNAITGVLTEEMANEIIEGYNKSLRS